jgi:hypothetical protein
MFAGGQGNQWRTRKIDPSLWLSLLLLHNNMAKWQNEHVVK